MNTVRRCIRLLGLGLAVSLLGCSDGSPTSEPRITIEWSPHPTASGFAAYLLEPDATVSQRQMLPADSTRITWAAEEPGTYRYCVASIDSSGLEGPCSAVGSLTR